MADEEEMDRLLAALDDAAMQRDALQEQLGAAEQAVDDVKLELQAELLGKDERILALEVQLVEYNELKSKITTGHGVMTKAEQEAETFKQAFETVKQWHADLSAKMTQQTQEYQAVLEGAARLEAVLDETRGEVESKSQIVEKLELALKADEDLILQNEAIEEAYKAQNTNLRLELTTYKEAWAKLSDTMASKEKERRQREAQLQQKIAELQEEVANSKRFLVPRWQRLAEEHEAKGGSIPSANLKAHVEVVNAKLFKDKSDFLFGCVPTKLWTDQISRLDIVLSLSRSSA